MPPRESVKATLYCLSLRFAAATAKTAGGNEYRAEISSEAELPTNGELMLMPPDIDIPYSHGGFLRLIDKRTGAAQFLTLNVDIPEFRDVNQDGLNDFLETDQAVAEVTTKGGYQGKEGVVDSLEATWSRKAGCKTGVCQLKLAGLDLTLVHQFELIQFDGGLEYIRESLTNLTGRADLRQLEQSTNRLDGPAELTVATTDQLYLASGSWTDDTGAKLPFEVPEALDRKNHHYLAYLAFGDGDPRTKIVDYIDWVLVVDDPRDADGDGVPDLTDLGDPPPRPTLSLRVTTDEVRLTLAGEVGRTYEFEVCSDLTPAEWEYALTVTLTNEVQQIGLPSPASERLFWRVKAP